MTVTIYGIKNCDTMKKAMLWLTDYNVTFEFHDYRKQGLEREKLAEWVDRLGWETLLNKQGMTFRKLEPDMQKDLTVEKAMDLMLQQPAMIRRPVLEHEGEITVGFKPGEYMAIFA
ncbi:ArsC family reductase [Aureimonas fodinaquatilis]|uniref:ArsC family reductase n=1 Tax=Aureimonas fodinaquatilis TaxID=2565783 RepID=A0A5B0DWG4_9HYPH|nr:ArsC family reductase [Aureimonas fodinaquatilis]KAA0971167.1 ArsC family reductase [Aureimonas fodinaquatilis]